MIGGTSSHALRRNSRCTWRHREGSRNVYNTAIRRALSPLCPCGSVTADVHGCPRGVAPLRPPIAIRANPMAHTGGETAQSPHNFTGCAARPSILFSPPGHGFSTLDARWKLLSGIIRGDTVGLASYSSVSDLRTSPPHLAPESCRVPVWLLDDGPCQEYNECDGRQRKGTAGAVSGRKALNGEIHDTHHTVA